MTADQKHAPLTVEADEDANAPSLGKTLVMSGVKLALAATFFYAAYHRVLSYNDSDMMLSEEPFSSAHRRRLSEFDDSSVPSYMQPLLKDLQARKDLFRESPREEVKYWFEYSGPLQKYFYRYSKQRGKADYFEGRDDSGVVSARFIPDFGGTKEYQDMLLPKADTAQDVKEASLRLYENCLALGSASRPNTGDGTTWNEWYGSASYRPGEDRCRVLFALNTVGAGRGTTMLWETNPPVAGAEEPPRWISEQHTAATHLERNLREINAMCQTGLIAARIQILVCENISPKWIDWMDSLVVDCGGRPWTDEMQKRDKLDERPSPVQIVVASSAQTAETCHDLKSGFMEKRSQDLILAHSGNPSSPNEKTTDPSLVSSDEHDLYVSMKWNTLVTTRAISSFLQASADLVAAAKSPMDKTLDKDGPASNFLIPSFVQVSYVSEENSKIAKWRMHGDFFHPAAWEICKESFETTWIPHSLAGTHGMESMCPADDSNCGQWWVYFTELQMPTSPGVYANEAVPAPVQGGSNAFWMLTERHRREYVKGVSCRKNKEENCMREPQAVIPLGDLESFLINFTPNTALGKKHLEGRRPGYTKAEEFARDREAVKERQQLEDEDIEAALFDYTIYPAALFHKDATLKAARKRDVALSPQHDSKNPFKIKSSYYDITITKPRPPVLGWCQAMARKGLCSLFADYFRSAATSIRPCAEACGMARDFTPVNQVEQVEIGTAVAAKKE